MGFGSSVLIFVFLGIRFGMVPATTVEVANFYYFFCFPEINSLVISVFLKPQIVGISLLPRNTFRLLYSRPWLFFPIHLAATFGLLKKKNFLGWIETWELQEWAASENKRSISAVQHAVDECTVCFPRLLITWGNVSRITQDLVWRGGGGERGRWYPMNDPMELNLEHEGGAPASHPARSYWWRGGNSSPFLVIRSWSGHFFHIVARRFNAGRLGEELGGFFFGMTLPFPPPPLRRLPCRQRTIRACWLCCFRLFLLPADDGYSNQNKNGFVYLFFKHRGGIVLFFHFTRNRALRWNLCDFYRKGSPTPPSSCRFKNATVFNWWSSPLLLLAILDTHKRSMYCQSNSWSCMTSNAIHCHLVLLGPDSWKLIEKRAIDVARSLHRWASTLNSSNPQLTSLNHFYKI